MDLTDETFKRCQLEASWCFSVADVDAEERVDDSLVEILQQKFGRDFEPEFWSSYQNRSLFKILK